MHLALNSDIRVCHRCGKELAQGSQHECHGRRNLPLLLHRILHLLKECVLQDGVDDQHQRRDDAGEQGLGPLVFQEGHERANRAGSLAALGNGAGAGAGLDIIRVLAARGDARVDDPDRVCDDDGRRAGDGARDYGLNGRELLAGAAGAAGGLFEEGPGPFVPVVVDEVGDADAEQRRVDARVEARDALARNDLLDGFDEFALGFSGFDLGSGGEGDERVAGESAC